MAKKSLCWFPLCCCLTVRCVFKYVWAMQGFQLHVYLYFYPQFLKKTCSLYRLHSKNVKWCAGLDSGFPQLSWGFLLPHLPLLAFVWPCWAQPRPRVLLRLSEAGPVQGATCTQDPGSSPISSKQQHDDEIVWCRRNGKQNGLPAPFWSWSDTLEIGFPLLREVV